MTEISSSIPAFIAKLWEMVNNKNYDNLIQWCKDGTSFVIKDPIKFCTDLLPFYYKHNNLASFSRQLNKYGFKKVTSIDSASLKNDKNDLEFCHPYFMKNYPELLTEIKRKITEKSEPLPNVMVKIANEVQQLQKKQDHLESKLRSMKNENTALWREHSLLRHKHQNLQKLLNKLIQFLLTLVQQTRGLNIKRINLPLMLKDRSQPTDSFVAIKNHSHNQKSNINKHIDSNEPEIMSDELDDSDTTNILKTFNNLNYSSLFNKDVTNKSQVSSINPTLVAVPLQEISPAIVYGKAVGTPNYLEQKTIPNTVTMKGKKRTSEGNIINIPKKVFIKPNTSKGPVMKQIKKVPVYIKGGKLTPVAKTSMNSALKTSEIGSKLPSTSVPNYVISTEPEVVISIPETSQNQGENITTDNDHSLPIIVSPSGSLLSPGIVDTEDDNENKQNNPVANSDQSLEPLQKDIENHIGVIQSDLDILKDLLQGEGISLDASTLLGFLNDDPLSLNMPEAMGLPSDSASTGSELISYNTPTLLDIVDSLEDSENPDYTSLPTSTLNTPKPEYTFEFTDSSPNKQMSK